MMLDTRTFKPKSFEFDGEDSCSKGLASADVKSFLN